ncbi:MAG: ATP-binding protein [Candidatus Zixiibacteriota bacterium]
MDDTKRILSDTVAELEEVSRFTESYASFHRIIGSLQRKYLELKEEFSAQNEQLVKTNKKLVELTERNLVVTEFLNSILDSVSAGVIAVDQNGTITHFNPAASVILGIPPREPLGKHYREVIPAGTPADANALRAAETGCEVASIEKKMELPDGTRLNLSVSTSILRDRDGRANGAVEVFQDLTKIKRMEQELARLNTLAALGEMAATIAHEVRNPLSSIAGFASLLERELDPADPKRKLTGKIIRGVDGLNETVMTLLNYTRFDELNKTEIDLEKFLQGSVDQFRQQLDEKSSQVHIELCPVEKPAERPISLIIDRLLIRQALFNILTNAVEAVKGKGRIRISFHRLPRQKAVALYAERILLGLDETIVETSVTDDGPGLSPEYIDRIFAPFFTTKKEGSGLGLAVAWKIVKAHGGDIVAENTGQGGAVFRLLLPAKIEAANEGELR